MRKVILICLIFLSCNNKNTKIIVVNKDPLISYYKNGKDVTIYHSDFNLVDSNELHSEGLDFAMNNNLVEARKKFLSALLEEPNNPVILNNIGNVEYSDYNFEKAIKYFNKSLIESDSTYFFAAHNLGRTYGLIGENEKSEEIFKFVISKTKIQFLKGVSNYNLADMYLDYGEIEKGLEAVEKAKIQLAKYKDFQKELDDLQNEMKKYYN